MGRIMVNSEAQLEARRETLNGLIAAGDWWGIRVELTAVPHNVLTPKECFWLARAILNTQTDNYGPAMGLFGWSLRLLERCGNGEVPIVDWMVLEAELHERLNRWSEAIAWWERAQAASPDSHFVSARLADARQQALDNAADEWEALERDTPRPVTVDRVAEWCATRSPEIDCDILRRFDQAEYDSWVSRYNRVQKDEWKLDADGAGVLLVHLEHGELTATARLFDLIVETKLDLTVPPERWGAAVQLCNHINAANSPVSLSCVQATSGNSEESPAGPVEFFVRGHIYATEMMTERELDTTLRDITSYVEYFMERLYDHF